VVAVSLSLGNSDFEIVSDFEFRVSDLFGTLPRELWLPAIENLTWV